MTTNQQSLFKFGLRLSPGRLWGGGPLLPVGHEADLRDAASIRVADHINDADDLSVGNIDAALDVNDLLLVCLLLVNLFFEIVHTPFPLRVVLRLEVNIVLDLA